MASAKAPRLSVLLITYNHAEYVQEALNSVLMQQIDEPFDIIVADDASTDETVVLIAEVARKNPQVSFRFIEKSLNLGITKNYQRAFSACDAEYVAVLEGDDYWVSPRKLKEQRDFLDSHRECDLCSVNYYVFEEHRSQFTPRTTVGPGHVIFGARELIADNLVGNFSTCMYRMSAVRQIPSAVYDVRSYDWAINICIGRRGLIGFLKEPMSVYRIHDSGAWSVLSHIEKLKTQLALIPAYDGLTDHVFHHEFAMLSERIVKVIAESQSGHGSAQAEVAVIELLAGPQSHSRILDLVPPVVITLGRELFPPAFKRYLAKLVFGG